MQQKLKEIHEIRIQSSNLNKGVNSDYIFYNKLHHQVR